MPEMDGYEVCQRLKAHETTKEIPVIFITAKTATGDEVKGFEVGGVDYITKPISPPVVFARIKAQLAVIREKKLMKENIEIKKTANQKLSQKNEQILKTLEERDHALKHLKIEQKKTREFADLLKKMFGRYLSPEVMNAILKDPTTLKLGGEKRNVTLMITDLRGFAAFCERFKPEQVVQMLNGYCKIMIKVIDKYKGTVNEIIGDSLLVIFGAPTEMHDRTHRAIACAIEMQNAMVQVNRQNRLNGLPSLEMGIGIHETEVIVGNIGSDKRSKYSVVGSGVNLTSRIESYTVGGQILVSESVYNKLGPSLGINSEREVYPKGAETPLKIYDVVAIAEPWNIALIRESSLQIDLSDPIQVECRLVEDKAVKNDVIKGTLVQLSEIDCQIKFPLKMDIFTNLQINLRTIDTNLASTHFNGKIIRLSDKNKTTHTVRFTFVPDEIRTYFQSLLS